MLPQLCCGEGHFVFPVNQINHPNPFPFVHFNDPQPFMPTISNGAKLWVQGLGPGKERTGPVAMGFTTWTTHCGSLPTGFRGSNTKFFLSN
jgi:hypothetical protein